ncbi:MAG: ABC transporter substrate-binding protein [Candidatus Entotheonellia bacterium]
MAEKEVPMSPRHPERWSRRAFLRALTLAGPAGLVAVRAAPAAAEPPPEATRLAIVQSGVCFAPQYVAEALLRAEGFSDVTYVKTVTTTVDNYEALAAGTTHLGFGFASALIARIDGGDPLVFVAGGHVGCQQIVGHERLQAIRDLRGKRIAIAGPGAPDHIQVASILAYVGIDPRTDVEWVTHGGRGAESMRLFVQGAVDACLLSPPLTQERRAKGIGRVLLDTTLDRPWSQYFCCMSAANQEFARNYPVATKRALRAILKAADICALEPERVARGLVERGVTTNYEYAAQAMREVPYGQWRDYSPEDTIRFYALRLHEVGMIKSTPQQIMAQGADWHFLTELKKELKG